MSETATATKKARASQAAERVNPLTVADLITQTLAADEPYQAAMEKLRDIEAGRAKAQAELDQASAVCSDTEELTRKILEDGEVGNREQAFAKRQALAQVLEAYDGAISQQRTAILQRRNEASERVKDALQPIYIERTATLIASLEAFEAAFNEWAELQRQISVRELAITFNFAGREMIAQTLRTLKIHFEQRHA